MTGYTRQSVADIINGAEITAPPLNSEFNQLTSAFNGGAGHSHDGSTGNAPPIALATSVSGYLPAVHGGIGGKNNNTATTTPLVTNDGTEGYAPMSLWENTTTGRIYVCVGNSTGAAIWRELVQVTSGNSIIPAAHDTVDLGSNAVRFQDIFLSGGISASGNVAVGGTLTLTGSTSLQALTAASATVSGTSVLTSVDINSGAMDATAIGVSTPAAGTFTTLTANTSLVAATADINGGTIDGATIGASAPSTAAFTTLAASGLATLATVDINAGAIDGTVIGATTKAAGGFTTITSTGQATLATVDINGGAIDGAVIGAASAAAITGTTITGSSLVGPLTGSVTGNTAGTHTGAVVGNVTGDVTGNVTASSGTSTFNNVTVNGTLNMDATTAATITNLTNPTNAQDAATKAYVDTSVANLIDSAPGALDTLNELAAALGDDAAFSTTITNSIATKLPLAGGTMSGAIAMGTSKITGLGDPTTNQDAATKKYSDDQDALKLSLTGGTMSGAIAMGNNKITGLGTPTASTDATTKTYVDAILGSATAAATSAANAATSESNAATSETNAGNSASAALASQNAAAASYDLFDDRFLGAKSSAPTLDNDGNALVTGTLYFNSTSNIMYVYSGAGWQAAGSSVNGTSDRQTYTASAGQTVFAATYDTGYIDVYLNGVKLVAGTDFTATNGTSITLASGATINDVIDIVAYGTFVLADHYDSTASDARYVQQTHTGNVDITGDLSFGDNNKAIFGAGSDLQIYHDGGSDSYITHSGSNGLGISAPTISLTDNVGRNMLRGVSEGATTLYHNNSEKLATTATGIDVTGTVTASSAVNAVGFQDTQSTSGFGYLNFGDTDDANIGQIGYDHTSNYMRFQVNNAERMRIDSSGNVGIGTSSPSQKLDVNGSVNIPNDYSYGFGGAGSNTYISGNNASNILRFNTNGSERMRIFENGNVGIGTTDSRGKLQIGSGVGGGYVPSGHELLFGANNSDITFLSANDGVSVDGTIGAWNTSYNVQNSKIVFNKPAGNIGELQFFTNAGSGITERMRIDPNGNLLVGTTSTTPAVSNDSDGIALQANGTVQFSANNTTTAIINRKSTDGTILQFRKDGTTVGSIGILGGATYFSSVTHALMINGSTVEPANYIGTRVNNTMDIGSASYRFKDLYLSGGVYLGGTVAANHLDDYEEGTWTPSFYGLTNTPTYHGLDGKYTKVGRVVTVTFFVQTNVLPTFSSLTDELKITGLPFTVNGTGYTGSQGACNAQNFNWNSTYNTQGVAGQISASVNSSEQMQFQVTGNNGIRGIVNNKSGAAGFIIEATVTYFVSD
jgi:hypothetical protein